DAEGLGEGVQPFLAPGEEPDAHPSRAQIARELRADAAGGPGDERDPVAEVGEAAHPNLTVSRGPCRRERTAGPARPASAPCAAAAARDRTAPAGARSRARRWRRACAGRCPRSRPAPAW